MSLEQALADNTAAIKALTVAWSKLTANAAAIDALPAGTKVEAAGKPVNAAPKSSKAAATPTAAGTGTAKAEPAAASPSEGKPVAETSEPEATAAPAASSSVDYATLQKAVFALANKSREAAGAVAKALGVVNFKGFEQATGEERANALAAVNDARAGLDVA